MIHKRGFMQSLLFWPALVLILFILIVATVTVSFLVGTKTSANANIDYSLVAQLHYQDMLRFSLTKEQAKQYDDVNHLYPYVGPFSKKSYSGYFEDILRQNRDYLPSGYSEYQLMIIDVRVDPGSTKMVQRVSYD